MLITISLIGKCNAVSAQGYPVASKSTFSLTVKIEKKKKTRYFSTEKQFTSANIKNQDK